MSFETWVRLVFAGLLMGGGVANVGLSFSRKWLASRGRAFAKRNLAWIGASLVHEFDALTRRRARGIGVISLIVAAGVATIPLPAHDDDTELSFLVASVAVAFFAMVALHLWLLVASAPAGEPRLRVARTRAVSLNDYVWPWSRASFLALSVVALAVALVGIAASRQPGVDAARSLMSAGLSLTFVVGVLVTDRVVAHIAGIREPAEDQAHLYWQDAYRAETIARLYGLWVSGAVGMVAQATTGISHALTEAHKSNPVSEMGAWMLPITAAVVLIPTALSAVHGRPGQQWFRKRLWPTLAPGQVLRPGETVPAKVGEPA
jgi:hypothetical protein